MIRLADTQDIYDNLVEKIVRTPIEDWYYGQEEYLQENYHVFIRTSDTDINKYIKIRFEKDSKTNTIEVFLMYNQKKKKDCFKYYFYDKNFNKLLHYLQMILNKYGLLESINNKYLDSYV